MGLTVCTWNGIFLGELGNSIYFHFSILFSSGTGIKPPLSPPPLICFAVKRVSLSLALNLLCHELNDKVYMSASSHYYTVYSLYLAHLCLVPQIYSFRLVVKTCRTVCRNQRLVLISLVCRMLHMQALDYLAKNVITVSVFSSDLNQLLSFNLYLQVACY